MEAFWMNPQRMETGVKVYASLPYPDTVHPVLANMIGPDGVFRGGSFKDGRFDRDCAHCQHDEKAGVGNLRVAFVVGRRRRSSKCKFHTMPLALGRHLGRISRSAGCLRSCDDTRCVCFWDYLFSQTTFLPRGPKL
jgi:hypothetical protein